MSRLSSLLKWAAFVGALFVAAVPALFSVVSWWLTWQPKNRPVVDRFAVETVDVLPGGDIELAGHFYKLYTDSQCEFQRLRFFALEDGQRLRVDRPVPTRQEVSTQFADRRKVAEDNNRDEGYNPFHGWQIGASEWPESRAVQGRVYHTCYGVLPFVTDLPPVHFTPDGELTSK